MFDRIWVVLRKEVVDNLRDRRTLMTAVLVPLLGPVLMVTMFMVIGSTRTKQAEKPLELPVAGAENAPNLIEFLHQHNTIIQPAPADPEAAVKAGDADVVLIIPEGFGDDFTTGRPATVQLVLDDSRQTGDVARHRIRQLLNAYSNTIGNLRLLARGVSPTVTSALAVETVSVATEQSRAAQVLGVMPYFVILSIFVGGMYLAIDTTAGERERRSLEPLLINPVARRDFVLGKYGATLAFTLVSTIEVLIAFLVILNRVPLEQYLGIRLTLNAGAVFAIFLISLPIMLLAPALQIIIATSTRSFKEAQNYLSLLPMVPALPGLFLAFMPVKAKLWMMLIPTYGQQLLINQLMRGEPVEAAHVAVSVVATTIVALLGLWLAVKLYERERTVFGR